MYSASIEPSLGKGRTWRQWERVRRTWAQGQSISASCQAALALQTAPVWEKNGFQSDYDPVSLAGPTCHQAAVAEAFAQKRAESLSQIGHADHHNFQLLEACVM